MVELEGNLRGCEPPPPGSEEAESENEQNSSLYPPSSSQGRYTVPPGCPWVQGRRV